MNDARVFGFDGTLLPSIQLYGRRVDVVIKLDHDEIGRRTRARTKSLRDRDLMEALASLPHGIKVPWESIDPVIHAVLDDAPEAALQKDQTYVERLYEPAVCIVGLLKRSRSWLQGLEAISLFAQHGPRGLILMGDGNLDETLSRAERIGVGIAHKEPGADPRLLSRPSSRYIRSGPSHWLFCEAVYSYWLDRCKQSAQAFS